MSESELKQLIAALEQALGVFQSHRGNLTVEEISIRSMLTVLRRQAAASLLRARKTRLDEREV